MKWLLKMLLIPILLVVAFAIWSHQDTIKQNTNRENMYKNFDRIAADVRVVETPDEVEERKFEERMDRLAKETGWSGSPKQKAALRRMKEAFENDPELAKEWGVQ